jgi:hypothetical protein
LVEKEDMYELNQELLSDRLGLLICLNFIEHPGKAADPVQRYSLLLNVKTGIPFV